MDKNSMGSAGNWRSDEIAVVVSEYMAMLGAQASGSPFVKADHNRTVQAATGRSKGAVEFKFCNISAVLQAYGHGWVQGYLPRANYQSDLEAAVLAFQIPVSDRPTGANVVVSEVPEIDRGSRQGGLLRLEHLWERATGGSAVAVSPTHEGEGPWPEGPSALGADEAVASLIRTLWDGPADQQRIVFLVGGPGNGKSALARRATQGLEMIGAPEEHIAHREYLYKTPTGRRLVVINDATIPGDRSDTPHGSLAGDVSSALRTGACMLANINRGVLYEELSRRMDKADSTEAHDVKAREILLWLDETATGLGDDGNRGLNPVSTKQLDPMASGVSSLQVQIVLMDVCSLLEQRPAVVIDDLGVAQLSKPYTITRLAERLELDLEAVPAAVLLSRFHTQLDPSLRARPDWDPIRANIEALDSVFAQRGLLTLLRAAELASSRRLSYRELWGAYVRAIVGGLPEWVSPEQGLTYLPSTIPDASQPNARFQKLSQLAELRFHQSIVRAASLKRGPRATASSVEKNPVLRLTTMVDPARDATPEWSQPVIESLAFPDEHHSPLRTLADHPASAHLPQVLTAFDWLLDEAYVASLGVVADSERRSIDSWYGGYLLRLFAIANSRPAFLYELDQWTRAWQVEGWPSGLKAALRTLIFPRRTKDGPMCLPVLEARAHPVVGNPETPRLVRLIETQDTGFKKIRRGEALFVSIAAGAGEPAELELDFDLLREALACNDGELGLSDRARATLPRLERFRANLLRPELDLAYAIVSRDQESQVELEQS